MKIGDRTVQELSQAAGLTLTADRAQVLAPQLEALLTAADELSESMSRPAWDHIQPVTQFSHRKNSPDSQ